MPQQVRQQRALISFASCIMICRVVAACYCACSDLRTLPRHCGPLATQQLHRDDDRTHGLERRLLICCPRHSSKRIPSQRRVNSRTVCFLLWACCHCRPPSTTDSTRRRDAALSLFSEAKINYYLYDLPVVASCSPCHLQQLCAVPALGQ